MSYWFGEAAAMMHFSGSPGYKRRSDHNFLWACLETWTKNPFFSLSPPKQTKIQPQDKKHQMLWERGQASSGSDENLTLSQCTG